MPNPSSTHSGYDVGDAFLWALNLSSSGAKEKKRKKS